MTSRQKRHEDRPSWVDHVADRQAKGEVDGEATLAARVLSSVESLEDIRDDSWTVHRYAGRWAKFWTGWHYTLGLPAALLAGVAGISAIQDNTTLATWFAFASALVSATITFLRPEEQEKRLDLRAVRAKDVSNRARLFLQTGMPNLLFDGDRLVESGLPQVHATVASLLEELAAIEQNTDPELIRERNSRFGGAVVHGVPGSGGPPAALAGESYIGAGTGNVGPADDPDD